MKPNPKKDIYKYFNLRALSIHAYFRIELGGKIINLWRYQRVDMFLFQIKPLSLFLMVKSRWKCAFSFQSFARTIESSLDINLMKVQIIYRCSSSKINAISSSFNAFKNQDILWNYSYLLITATSDLVAVSLRSSPFVSLAWKLIRFWSSE